KLLIVDRHTTPYCARPSSRRERISASPSETKRVSMRVDELLCVLVDALARPPAEYGPAMGCDRARPRAREALTGCVRGRAAQRRRRAARAPPDPPGGSAELKGSRLPADEPGRLEQGGDGALEFGDRERFCEERRPPCVEALEIGFVPDVAGHQDH